MPDETPVPHAPPTVTDEMRTSFPEDFARALDALGATEEFATDVQREAAGALVLKAHSADLYRSVHEYENRKAGHTLDTTQAPEDFTEKAARAKITDREYREFARANYDEPGDQMQHLASELSKAKKHSEDKDFVTKYGNPNAGG